MLYFWLFASRSNGFQIKLFSKCNGHGNLAITESQSLEGCKKQIQANSIYVSAIKCKRKSGIRRWSGLVCCAHLFARSLVAHQNVAAILNKDLLHKAEIKTNLNSHSSSLMHCMCVCALQSELFLHFAQYERRINMFSFNTRDNLLWLSPQFSLTRECQFVQSLRSK